MTKRKDTDLNYVNLRARNKLVQNPFRNKYEGKKYMKENLEMKVSFIFTVSLAHRVWTKKIFTSLLR